MKYSLFPATLLPCLATAVALLIPFHPVAADSGYTVETHGPRIGTRILLFFKDLAYGENPNERYRATPAHRPPINSLPHSSGARPLGDRFSLDQPPPVNSLPAPRPAQPRALPPEVAARTMPPREMPYTSEDVSRISRGDEQRYQAGIGGEREAVPTVKIKPKPVPVERSTAGTKLQEESTPPKPPAEKKSLPTETAAVESQVASNAPPASKRSWQTLGSEDAGASSTTSGNSFSTETKSTSTPPPSGSATLTGSKTTKEGRVKSPYPPYNELDVTGLPAGSLAMDPTTGKVFRVP